MASNLSRVRTADSRAGAPPGRDERVRHQQGTEAGGIGRSYDLIGRIA